ncbi:MAG: tyrosine-protein phosphatase, partial [Anaerolineales bacterium]|nr:tyrosine-protein phosphatase [Anaerolineales bacterium]
GALSLAAGALAVWAVARVRTARRARPAYPAAEALLPEPGDDVWTHLEPDRRRLALPGAVNLRDIGGYATTDGRRVRWGRVWRSGSLAGLDEPALARLAELGLRTVCDLRTPQEAARYPDRLPAGAAYALQPAYPDGNTAAWLRTLIFRRHELDVVFEEGYVRMAAGSAPVFGAVLRQIADPANQPYLVHCTAGKDRTGIVIALLLLLLGVPEDVVLADYALSNRDYPGILAAAQDDVRRITALGFAPEELRPILTAHPRNLRRLLAFVRARHGSVEAYLREAAGVGPEVAAQLRAHLLTEQ